MIIAIDGPSGAGKSTVSKSVAKALGFNCLDTGAMYRSIAWYALEHGVSLEDSAALGEIARERAISFSHEPGNPAPKQVFIDGVDVTAIFARQRIDRSGEFRLQASRGARGARRTAAPHWLAG